MLVLGCQSDLQGTLLDLVELLFGKTADLLLRKPDGLHLGRDAFFGCLWQWSVASVDDVDKGLATIVFGKKCLDWMD